ncbi:MAG: hypothetical protein J0L63_05990 [Anaerolineae bacterium]|nr:hypothetical protein [Anaerolineae bacterium]
MRVAQEGVHTLRSLTTAYRRPHQHTIRAAAANPSGKGLVLASVGLSRL